LFLNDVIGHFLVIKGMIHYSKKRNIHCWWIDVVNVYRRKVKRKKKV